MTDTPERKSRRIIDANLEAIEMTFASCIATVKISSIIGEEI